MINTGCKIVENSGNFNLKGLTKMAISGTLLKRMTFILCILCVKCVPNNFVGFREFPSELRMSQGVPYQPEVDIFECCYACAHNDSCTSVNYNAVSKVCEINTLKMKSREYHLQPEAGWKLYEKLPCGLGYMTGDRCRHIQNLFQDDDTVTCQEARDFCHLLGENLVKVNNAQEKSNLESDAVGADAYIYAFFWLGNSTETTCSVFRRKNSDIIDRDCYKTSSVACERN